MLQNQYTIYNIDGSGIMIFFRYEDETDQDARILLMYNQLYGNRNYFEEPGGEFLCQNQEKLDQLAKSNAIKELYEESAMSIKIQQLDNVVGPILVSNRYLCFIAYIVLSRKHDFLNELRNNFKVIDQNKLQFDYQCRECTDWELVDAYDVPRNIGTRKVNDRPFYCLKEIYSSEFVDFENKKINIKPIILKDKLHTNKILKQKGRILFTDI